MKRKRGPILASDVATMLKMRAEGCSLTTIARQVDCDHSTVLYHIDLEFRQRHGERAKARYHAAKGRGRWEAECLTTY